MSVELKCPVRSCEYVTPELSEACALQLLQMHHGDAHAAPAAAPAPAAAELASPVQATRPELTTGITEEDWTYFEDRWTTYKMVTGISGAAVSVHLMECCEESLRRDLHRNLGRGLARKDEAHLLAEIRKLSVKENNRMVNRVQFGDLRQETDEPVRNFAARVKGQASVCNYTVPCPTAGCEATVSFADEVIRDQVVRGLRSRDIQKDLLSYQLNKSMQLDDVLFFVEAKEAGLRSLGGSSEQSGSHPRSSKPRYQTHDRDDDDDEDTCSFCGRPGHGHRPHIDQRKAECPAWGKRCTSCGKNNHNAAVCSN